MSDEQSNPQTVSGATQYSQEVMHLRRRLTDEASVSIAMLEDALGALWAGDVDQATDVRAREKNVDVEEVEIEQECLRLMTLYQPFAHDFRVLAFCLKVNQDIERVADHASAIAKITRRLVGPREVPWPTALRDMGARVPMLCHELLKSVLKEDVESAREIIEGDKVIDSLEKKLFDEVREWIQSDPDMISEALVAYRMGRDLERVGDLMANIAEDLVYLKTGTIVRHTKDKPT